MLVLRFLLQVHIKTFKVHNWGRSIALAHVGQESARVCLTGSNWSGMKGDPWSRLSLKLLVVLLAIHLADVQGKSAIRFKVTETIRYYIYIS